MIHHSVARSLKVHIDPLNTILEVTGETHRRDLAYAMFKAWLNVPAYLRKQRPLQAGELRAGVVKAEARFDRVACWWSCRLMEVQG